VTAEFDIATKAGVHFEPVSNIDATKIFPSSSQLDYFHLLAKSGSRLGALKAKSGTLSEFQNRFVKLERTLLKLFTNYATRTMRSMKSTFQTRR
jgi:hypothetical protein